MLADRLLRLPRLPLAGIEARLACTPLARLRGLAGLDADAVAGTALLLPRTRSIHTFGMRFALDLVWIDRAGRVLRVDRDVPPRRLRGCHAAACVLELPAGGAASWAASSSSSGAGLPR